MKFHKISIKITVSRCLPLHFSGQLQLSMLNSADSRLCSNCHSQKAPQSHRKGFPAIFSVFIDLV